MCKRSFKKEITELFASSSNISSKVYTLDMIKDLPSPVKRYFRYTLTENQPLISYVRFKHGGKFKPATKWVSIKGEEYFTIENPGFIWIGKIPLVKARDMYLNGKGMLTIKLLSLFTIAEQKGNESDQGEMLRWLSEIPCAPTALLPSEYLHWEPIDEFSAKAILNVHNNCVEGIFYFNDIGQITKFKAKRYKDKELEDWIGTYSDYRLVEGMKIPFYIEAMWSLQEGVLEYVKFLITSIEYNNPKKY